jgi:hypothetical protein
MVTDAIYVQIRWLMSVTWFGQRGALMSAIGIRHRRIAFGLILVRHIVKRVITNRLTRTALFLVNTTPIGFIVVALFQRGVCWYVYSHSPGLALSTAVMTKQLWLRVSH